MRKVTSSLVAFVLANLFSIAAFAQNATISGNVKNSATGENAAAVSVTIKGSDIGTYTDDKGNFTITAKSVPATLVFTSVGYEPQELTANNASERLNVSFVPSNSLGQEVVVSASRVPEKIMESPVSIERVNATAIRNAPAANFYDVVTNLKGVDVTTSSLTFKTPTTRGFGGSGNVRFNQLVDGMDNQAPGLNFSVGAIVGLNELDVDNIELLSGASSALYGPGGMNGTLLMTSKSPFKYQGLSFVAKTGIMHTDGSERPASPYYNWALRWGKKISEKFAFKVTTELIHAKDWIGMDYRNFDRLNNVMVPGNRQTDPNYDGVNTYGDETTADLRAVLAGIKAAAPFYGPLIDSLSRNPINVSRTGYTEQELMNPNTINYKLGGALHYKLSSNTEAILSGHWGTGNTIYTGASRYSIQGFKMGQYKLEVNNKDWMLRAYTTQENAGGTFNLAATTQNFNESWKASPGSNGWYAQYGQAWFGAIVAGMTEYDAHQLARATADVGRPKVGTPQFNSAYDKVRRLPVPQGGALLDRTDLYSIEGSYNLSSITKEFADVLVGANFKRYALNSQGTLFADSTGAIGIKEFGAFVQASRDITDKIKIQASGRYDKNENFEGRFTPRITGLFKVAPNNNIRLSYQTAYRFPSTQQQWINLDLSSYKLIGGNKDFVPFYNFDTNPAIYVDDFLNGDSVRWNYKQQKPESLESFELGYKGLLLNTNLLIDMYGYYGNYTDFTGRVRVIQSKSGGSIMNKSERDPDIQAYSVPINYEDKIKTYGFGIGLDYRLPKNFIAGLNVSSDNLDVPDDVIASFNSPKYKANASIGNTGFGKGNRMGFNVVYRWQDEFYFEGDLASGTLPAVHTLDAQLSFKMPKSKSIFKVGANNLLNQYFYNAVGNSRIGGLYYVSFGYNVY